MTSAAGGSYGGGGGGKGGGGGPGSDYAGDRSSSSAASGSTYFKTAPGSSTSTGGFQQYAPAPSQDWPAALPLEMQAQIMQLQQQHQQQQNFLQQQSQQHPAIHHHPAQHPHQPPPSQSNNDLHLYASPDFLALQASGFGDQQHVLMPQHHVHEPNQNQLTSHHQQQQHFPPPQPSAEQYANHSQHTQSRSQSSPFGFYDMSSSSQSSAMTSDGRSGSAASVARPTPTSSPMVMQQPQQQHQYEHHEQGSQQSLVGHLEHMMNVDPNATLSSMNFAFPANGGDLSHFAAQQQQQHQQHRHSQPQQPMDAPQQQPQHRQLRQPSVPARNDSSQSWHSSVEGASSMPDFFQDGSDFSQRHHSHSHSHSGSGSLLPPSTPMSGNSRSGSSSVSLQQQQQQQQQQPHHQQQSQPTVQLVPFDYTDRALSAALASNAHINDPAARSSPHLFPGANVAAAEARGNTTPTIMEEDEDVFRRHQDASMAANFMEHQRGMYEAAPSLPAQHSPFQQQFPGQTGFHPHMSSPNVNMGGLAPGMHPNGMAGSKIPSPLARRPRPFLRPSLYQQYSNMNLSAMDDGRTAEDCLSFIDGVIDQYLATPSRLGLGERTVMIMTSKVAQKSYGAEKRFLCPPPMVLLVGSSWWSACHGSGSASAAEASVSNAVNEVGGEPTFLIPPRLSITMGGESSAPQQDGVLEWAASSGKLIDTDNPSSEFAISGRSIGRQLYINDSDEKRRHCEALVQITVPTLTSADRRSLGVFPSKPIKVISKPSKKRQSTRNSELGVNHGSTISLFHRLRAQTVSTRYLCVSGAPTWFKGSDGEPFLNTDANTHIPNRGEASSSFVAKTSSWDPFIVYLVDPHLPTSGGADDQKAVNGHTAPQQSGVNGDANQGRPAHFPSPPASALPFAHGATPIHYNQPVVLQCLNTAVVSPVMIIRRTDRGTTVVGGGQPCAPFGPGGPPPGDSYGEPVSQLHKVSFEMLEDHHRVPPSEGGPGSSGHFLGCLNEEVGVLRPAGPRQWIGGSVHSRPTTPTTPITPMTAQLPSSTPPTFGDSKQEPLMSPGSSSAMGMSSFGLPGPQARFPQPQGAGGSGPSSYAFNMHSHLASYPGGAGLADVSSDGGKVKRPRRVSSSVVVPQKGERGVTGSAATNARNRRRGQSLSVVGLQNQLQAQGVYGGNSGFSSASSSSTGVGHSTSMSSLQTGACEESEQMLRRTSSFANSLSNYSDASSLSMTTAPASSTSATTQLTASARSWFVDVHDSDVWTIVGVNIARHTFYLPPKLVNGVKARAQGVDASIAHLVTVPAPGQPITPLPVLHHFNVGPSAVKLGSLGGLGIVDGRTPASASDYVTLVGENFTTDLFVFFDDWRATQVSIPDRNTIVCRAPPPLDEVGVPRGRVQIILVRRDGVIFPTDSIYST